MSGKLSVIIPTHNPRPAYLQRVLEALKAQSLPKTEWELVLVDNASKEPVAERWDLSWHPNGRHIRENELGATQARMRGIREANGEWLLFVDDDNVLDTDYLREAVKAGNTHAFLGVIGGRIDPEFEEEPAEWTRQFWSYLALRPVEHSFWSNLRTDYTSFPVGAGFCLRRCVVEAYLRRTETGGESLKLGRRGTKLTSCEDTDMVLTACDLGYGYGTFVKMRMVHIMPKWRMTEEYLLRLLEGSTYSCSMMEADRYGMMPPATFKPWWRQKLGKLRRRLMMKRLDRLMLEARMRGWEAARDELIQMDGANGIRLMTASPMRPWRQPVATAKDENQ